MTVKKKTRNRVLAYTQAVGLLAVVAGAALTSLAAALLVTGIIVIYLTAVNS